MTDTKSTGPVYKIGQLALIDWRERDGTEHHGDLVTRFDLGWMLLIRLGWRVPDRNVIGEPVPMKPVPADALVLPERPTGLSGGWAEYDWRGIAKDEPLLVRRGVFRLIAEALEAVGIGRPGDNGEWPDCDHGGSPGVTVCRYCAPEPAGPVESPAGGEPIEGPTNLVAWASPNPGTRAPEGCGECTHDGDGPCVFECRKKLLGQPDQSVKVTAREVLGMMADCAGQASNMAGLALLLARAVEAVDERAGTGRPVGPVSAGSGEVGRRDDPVLSDPALRLVTAERYSRLEADLAQAEAYAAQEAGRAAAAEAELARYQAAVKKVLVLCNDNARNAGTADARHFGSAYGDVIRAELSAVGLAAIGDGEQG